MDLQPNRVSRRTFLKGSAAVAVAAAPLLATSPAVAASLGRAARAGLYRAAGQGAQLRGTITVLTSPDNGDAVADIAAKFMNLNPEVKINVNPISWTVLYPQILSDLGSKTGAFDATTWDLLTAGSIAEGMEDLTAFGQANPDLVDPDYDKDDFIPIAWHVYGTWQNKNIGFPFYGAAMFFFYRKDLFNDDKLKSAFQAKYGRELAVPKDWDEAAQVAEFFTKKYNPDSPTEYGYAPMWQTAHDAYYYFLDFWGPIRRSQEGVAKFGPADADWGDYFTADHKPAFNSPEAVRALEQLQTMFKYSSDPFATSYGEALEAFGKGQVPMVAGWSAMLSSWQEYSAVSPVAEKVGVTIVPGGHPCSGGWGLGINSYTKPENKRIAFAFIQYATNKENDKYHWMKHRVGPNRRSVISDPEVLQDSPWFEGVYEPSLSNASHRTRIPEQPKLTDLTGTWLSDISAGKKGDPLQALNALADEWMKVLGG